MLLGRLFSVPQGEFLLRAIERDDGSVTLMLLPRSTRIVERCSRAVAQVTRDLELFSSSEDEQNIWDTTGKSKSIEEIRAFLKK